MDITTGSIGRVSRKLDEDHESVISENKDAQIWSDKRIENET